MRFDRYDNRFIALIFSIILALSATAAFAQTNEFTYQGSLKDGAAAANGNYDLEFQLHTALTGGLLIGTRTRLSVPVINGVFTVKLDFSPLSFDGENRFLQIGVKTAGSPGGYQQLLPRQLITSSPYSFRSLNATTAETATTATTATNSQQLGGIAANQYVLTGDARLSDARQPLGGSNNYIQRNPILAQSGGFSIVGNGAAGSFDAVTQYQIGGSRVLGVPGNNNVFVGVNAGNANTTGEDNAFFGRGAGFDNTQGSRNAFFGRAAGQNNLTGIGNAFFGFEAGRDNKADFNSFFGSLAGQSTTTGFGNAFFGNSSGTTNTQGEDNSFFGTRSGEFNTTGNQNVFIGKFAGDTNTTGDNNTIIGYAADVFSNNLNYATAIGSGAVVRTSNTITIGRESGADKVNIWGDLLVSGSGSVSLQVLGMIQLEVLGTGGSTSLCLNSLNRIASCSSSLRYKTSVRTFNGGLDVVRRLRPIAFEWKDGGMKDVGFGAEEVERIEPLLTTRNDKGEIEGVKYPQLTTVLVNAVNEQQTQIEIQARQIDAQTETIKQQQEKLDQQKTDLEALKRFICSQNQTAEICQPKEKKQ